MIILFHCLSIIIFQLLRNRKRIKFLEKIEEEKTNLESTSSTEKLDLEHKIKFRPPLFRQRYAKVYDILLDERWRTNIKKLVDFGCSEFHMFTYLKRLSGINEIFFVDIDEKMLWRYQTRTYPLTTEYLQRRKTPLAVSIFAGSVADPDYRLLETDAVTAVELVEHLYPDVLDAFPYNIFNFIEPKLVMITTPNADFNVLFGNNTTRFRHYDHKFEWSREQFEDWARNIVVRFPDYIVSFCGLGNGPMGTEHLGQCTQMALFIRKDLLEDGYVSKTYGTPCLCTSDSRCKGLTAASKMLCNCVCALCSPSASYGVCTYYSYSMQMITYEIEDDEEQNPSYNIYYKCIHKADFPFDDDQRSEEEKFMDDFRYKIHNFGQMTSIYYNEEANRSEIPISFLIWEPSGGESISATEACKILIKYGFQVEACFIKQTGLYEDCVIYEPVMEEISSSSEASGYDSDYTKYQLNEESLSDWDEPYVKTETKKPSETLENTEGLSTDFNGFPNWLLQILGTQSVIDEVTPPGSQEEPHFYCQGDGLGVHPSVIAVEIDDDDEESTDSSNNTTADFAEVDQGLSSQDMSSLPEDSVGNPIETHDVLLETDNEETEEAGVGPTTSEQNESSPNSSSDKGSNDDT